MNLLITGGGTGGHLAIAKALGQECKRRGIYTLYIGSTKGQDMQWFGEMQDFSHDLTCDDSKEQDSTNAYKNPKDSKKSKDKDLKDSLTPLDLNPKSIPKIFSHIVFLESTPVVNQCFFGKFKALFKNLSEAKKAMSLIKTHKIEACISVGGFSAAGASFATLLCRTPLFIHEQNARMGALNRLLKPFARRFFSSFEFQNVTLMPYPTEKIFFDKQRVREKIKTILFIGGSQGARAINDFALKIAPILQEMGIKIIHQTGKLDYENVRKRYEDMGFSINLTGGVWGLGCDPKNIESTFQKINPESSTLPTEDPNYEPHTPLKQSEDHYDAIIFPFTNEMPDVMSCADFCISRAGASSLWELCANGLPTMFVPYPFAAKNHQFFNAKILSDKHLALLCPQEILSDINKILSDIFSLDIAYISRELIRQTQSNGAEMIIKNIESAL